MKIKAVLSYLSSVEGAEPQETKVHPIENW